MTSSPSPNNNCKSITPLLLHQEEDDPVFELPVSDRIDFASLSPLPKRNAWLPPTITVQPATITSSGLQSTSDVAMECEKAEGIEESPPSPSTPRSQAAAQVRKRSYHQSYDKCRFNPY